MSKYGKWLFVLFAGWILGWHSHRHWSSLETLPPTELQHDSSFADDTGKSGFQAIQADQQAAEKSSSADRSGFEETLLTGQYQNAIQLFNSQDSQAVKRK